MEMEFWEVVGKQADCGKPTELKGFHFKLQMKGSY